MASHEKKRASYKRNVNFSLSDADKFETSLTGERSRLSALFYCVNPRRLCLTEQEKKKSPQFHLSASEAHVMVLGSA